MLHTKFQGHWSIGSAEDFFKVFTIYGHGGHVGLEQLFFPKVQGGCISNLVAIGRAVSEEKSFEIVDGRTTEPAYTRSSPGAFGSGELKRNKMSSWSKKFLSRQDFMDR